MSLHLAGIGSCFLYAVVETNTIVPTLNFGQVVAAEHDGLLHALHLDEDFHVDFEEGEVCY